MKKNSTTEIDPFIAKSNANLRLHAATFDVLSKQMDDTLKKIDQYDFEGRMNALEPKIGEKMAQTLVGTLRALGDFEDELRGLDEDETELLADDELTPDTMPENEKHE
jgi:hypothetical protein